MKKLDFGGSKNEKKRKSGTKSMNKLDFGGSKNQKNERVDEIGQMLVSGALDDTKKMRKLGADTFPKSAA